MSEGPSRLPVVRDHARVLVVQDGHAIGSRRLSFGRSIRAYPVHPEVRMWSFDDVVPPHVPFDDGSRDFELQCFGLRLGDTVHHIFAVIGDPAFDLVESGDVPEPFDRFKVGGERLPEPPKA